MKKIWIHSLYILGLLLTVSLISGPDRVQAFALVQDPVVATDRVQVVESIIREAGENSQLEAPANLLRPVS